MIGLPRAFTLLPIRFLSSIHHLMLPEPSINLGSYLSPHPLLFAMQGAMDLFVRCRVSAWEFVSLLSPQ